MVIEDTDISGCARPSRCDQRAGRVESCDYHAYVVASPNTHPSGVPYRWVNPDAPIARCDAPLPNIPWKHGAVSKLPRLASAIMRGNERVLKRYATRSEIDWALILSLVNSGASFERVRACYIASRHPKHLDPSRRDFEKRLLAEYLRAKEQGDRADYIQAREMAERVKAWALSAEFPGTSPRTRETDRRVLLAHAEQAFKAGKHEWHLSIRDVEQAAQVTRMTAHRAMRRLIKAGWLVRKREFIGQYAQMYGWGSAVSSCATLRTLSPNACKGTSGEISYAAHPAFEHRGLGRHAGRIFASLVALGEATAKQLVALSGCSRPAVYRHLSAMLELQLVGYDPSRRVWWAYPERLDAVACYLKTYHIPAQRHARIARERAKYRGQLARCRSDRAGGVNPPPAR